MYGNMRAERGAQSHQPEISGSTAGTIRGSMTIWLVGGLLSLCSPEFTIRMGCILVTMTEMRTIGMRTMEDLDKQSLTCNNNTPDSHSAQRIPAQHLPTLCPAFWAAFLPD